MPWQNSMPGREPDTATMHQSWIKTEDATAQRNSGHPMADASRGDWQCPNTQCINHTNYPSSYVYGSSVNCKKCGTGKTAQRPGDWCCPNPQCINNRNCVYGSKPACNKCGCPRPPLNVGKANYGGQAFCPPINSGGTRAPASNGSHPALGNGPYSSPYPGMAPSGAPLPRQGDWHCPNPVCKNHTGNVVYASKTICPLCGMAKPDDESAALDGLTAPPAGSPATPPPASQVRRQPPMRMVNPQPPPSQPQFTSSQAAGWPQQVSYSNMAPKGQRREMRPGDWNCTNPGCKNFADNVVYGTKTHCPLCNAPRPLTSITPSALSGAVNMRPGDWHCPNSACKNHTHNVVYGSKPACPLCGALNPNDAGQDASIDGGVYLRRARSRSPV